MWIENRPFFLTVGLCSPVSGPTCFDRLASLQTHCFNHVSIQLFSLLPPSHPPPSNSFRFSLLCDAGGQTGNYSIRLNCRVSLRPSSSSDEIELLSRLLEHVESFDRLTFLSRFCHDQGQQKLTAIMMIIGSFWTCCCCCCCCCC